MVDMMKRSPPKTDGKRKEIITSVKVGICRKIGFETEGEKTLDNH